MKLNIPAFALSCALVWGFGLFFLTWWIIAFDGASEEITLIGRVYRGYTLTPAGSVVGLLWGLADGLLGGLIFAWLYNRLSGHKLQR
jgi:hypothetical protein